MTTRNRNTSFERIVRPHMDRLYRLAWRLTGNKAAAEDLFQELLTRAFVKLDDLVHIDEPGSWLSRVMYNLFIDEKRRYGRRRLVLVDEYALPGETIESLPAPGGPEQDHGSAERLQAIERALHALGEEHRVVVLLHDAEGYKIQEIEELMGIPSGTVKSRLHRARARLREILERDGTLL